MLNWVFVRVGKDSGLTGEGESSLEYKAQAVAAVIGELARYLIGIAGLNLCQRSV
jgi:hypothetical protein